MGLAIVPWYVARESHADGSVQAVLADHGLPAQAVDADGYVDSLELLLA